jgi:hypothetical protein
MYRSKKTSPKSPQGLTWIDEPDRLIDEPDRLIEEPDRLIEEPDRLMNRID